MDISQTDIPAVPDLLHSGDPFVPFSEFSVQALNQPAEDVAHWIECKLEEGKPFMIRGFGQTDEWRRAGLNNDNLFSLSSSEAIPVRNCQTGRDIKMRLRDLLSQTDHARTSSVRECLYAKDLHCPLEWVRALETILPSSLRHLGALDLFRVLPKEIAPEVLMAYVGTRKSFSGFHRCFSATVALNLLIESEGSGPGSICFGTDKASQSGYDTFMEDLGKSPHTDWTNISIQKLRSADFPIYVTNQNPGDLVIFPSSTAHQIWNVSSMVTKVVWNIMHAQSLVSFFDYVQPAYQRHCHTDTGRVPLIPLHAMQNESCGRQEMQHILETFEQLVEDEDIGRESTVSVKTVDTQGAVVECNFCGLTIWNRHLHCEKCGDFDLCLTCFVSGRSCKHVAEYSWAEMFPREHCLGILEAARGRVSGRSFYSSARKSRQRSLGALALAAVNARQQTTERLCHLCRDSHPAWKGVSCTRCSAFFCFRGLHRHFDIDFMPFLRSKDSWVCPKCSQACNCRCCHFSQPYQSKDKPVRARIKPVDSRGRLLGFVDNVFDQKRGKRASMVVPSTSPQPSLPSRGIKRTRVHTNEDYQAESPLQQGGSSGLANIEPNQTRREVFDYDPTHTVTPRRNYTGPSSPRTLGPLTPLRIGERIESRAATEVRPSAQPHPTHFPPPLPPQPFSMVPRETASRYHTSVDRDIKTSYSDEEESISILEKRLGALRRYAGDLLELSLVDSHAEISERISQLESRIEGRKRRKAEELFSNLNRDFPDLAHLAREEARRRGL